MKEREERGGKDARSGSTGSTAIYVESLYMPYCMHSSQSTEKELDIVLIRHASNPGKGLQLCYTG